LTVEKFIKEMGHFINLVRYPIVMVKHFTVAVRHPIVEMKHFTVEVKYPTVVVKHFTVAVKYLFFKCLDIVISISIVAEGLEWAKPFFVFKFK